MVAQDAALAAFHYVSIIGVVVILACEWALVCWARNDIGVRILPRLDLAYFIASIVLLISGILRVVLGMKGHDFYLNNSMFWLKIGIFALVGACSVPPTLIFLRWGKQLKLASGFVPEPKDWGVLKRWIHWELVGVLLLPVLAAMMARGIGY